MVKVQKSEVIQNCIDGLRLAQQEVQGGFSTDSIKPVFVTNEVGTLKFLTSTSTTNDSSYYVPNDRVWIIEKMLIRYTCSADVGNRTIRFIHQSSAGSTKCIITHSGTKAASTNTYYSLSRGTTTVTETVTGEVLFPFLSQIAMPGDRLRWLDTAAITANDTIIFTMEIREYSKEAFGIR